MRNIYPFKRTAGIFAAYAIANVVTGFSAFAWAKRAVQAQCDRHRAPLLAAG